MAQGSRIEVLKKREQGPNRNAEEFQRVKGSAEVLPTVLGYLQSN